MQTRPPVAISPLITVLTVITLELLRASGPLVDSVPASVPGKALVALVVFTVPLAAWPIGALLRGHAVLVSVAALAAGRLALQAFPAPPIALGLAGATVGVIALVVAVSRAEGGAAAIGLLCGVALDVAVRAVTGTWDPLWRPGPLPWLVVVVECAAALALAWWTVRQPATAHPCGPRAGTIGPFLGLAVLMCANPAFVASQAALPLPAACAALILGALFAVVTVGEVRHAAALAGRRPSIVAGVLLVCGVPLALLTTGSHVAALVMAVQVTAGLLLARALSAPPRAEGPRWAGLGAGLGFLLPVLPYQAHYDMPLGVPNVVWPLAAAAMLAIAAHRWPGPVPDPVRHEFTLTGICALALLAPIVTLVTTPAPIIGQPADGRLTLLSWNVHYGLSGAPAIDLEAIARVIESRDPDVVLLQEVSRGWPIGGGADMAEWLARRLRLDYVWAPAADGQFGNAIFSKVPLRDVATGGLPYGQGPMRRSYIAATVTVPGAGSIRLMNTHLQHRTRNTPTRLAQIDVLLRAWGGARPAVIAGDLNFMPSWPEERRFLDAGFVSAQDETGQSAKLTSPTDRPAARIDWIWGTRGVRFERFAILDEVTVSDHFPLEVTVGAD